MVIGKNNIEESVLRLARQVADDQMVELIGINLLGKGGRKALKVTIDKDGGVTVDDCARLSMRLEEAFEAEDFIEGSYSLEVSSPGVDRPLTAISDFDRSIGKLVRIVTEEKVGNQNFFIGRIIDVAEGMIRLMVGKREIDIPLASISKARLEIEIK